MKPSFWYMRSVSPWMVTYIYSQNARTAYCKGWYRLARRGSNATRKAYDSVHVHEVWTGCKHKLRTTHGNTLNRAANHFLLLFVLNTKGFAAQLRRVCVAVWTYIYVCLLRSLQRLACSLRRSNLCFVLSLLIVHGCLGWQLYPQTCAHMHVSCCVSTAACKSVPALRKLYRSAKTAGVWTKLIPHYWRLKKIYRSKRAQNSLKVEMVLQLFRGVYEKI